jgi:hypothetical protein
VTYVNDWVLRQTHFVGNNMPASIYGGLIVFVLFFNARLRRWRLTGGELAVVLGITLAACSIPGSGLLRTFNGALVMPHHYSRTEPAWRENRVLEGVPQRLFADVKDDADRVLDGYVQGLATGSRLTDARAIPWHAWRGPWLTWIPMALCILFAFVGLSLVLHRQWSENEHLPYPIATFTATLLPEDGNCACTVWRRRSFWIALGVVFAIHLNGYLARWFPDLLPGCELRLDFGPLANIFPILTRGNGGFLLRPAVFFAVIGLAFFISTDLAAAFGFGPILWVIASGTFATYGMSLMTAVEGGGYLGLQPRAFLLFGACVGIFLTLLYAGRNHYAAVLRGALWLRPRQRPTTADLWGARVFLGLSAAFVAQLVSVGIDWQLAILYTAILVVTATVSARLMAEGGLFHIKIDVFPCVVIWGILT